MSNAIVAPRMLVLNAFSPESAKVETSSKPEKSIFTRIYQSPKLREAAEATAAVAGLALIFGTPTYLLYNYNTVVLHPHFQSDYLSFDFSFRGSDILLISAASFIGFVMFQLRNFMR